MTPWRHRSARQRHAAGLLDARPESAHQINAAGDKSWVTYRFHSGQGVKNLTQAVANEIAGEHSDFHRRDLSDAIKAGDFPSRTMSVQVCPTSARRPRAGQLRAELVVPSIGSSPDKMLHGGVFAYADTQRYRIGPHYQQLPVGRHRVEGPT